MESVTDPSMLEGKPFFKMGLKIYDFRYAVVFFSVIAMLGLGGLMATGAEWAESWGEGDLESIEAGSAISEAFASEDDVSYGPTFTWLVGHDSNNHTDERWQTDVMESLAPFAALEEATITYSWERTPGEIDDYGRELDGTYWARNTIEFNVDRTEAKKIFLEHREEVEFPSGYQEYSTEGIAVDATFDDRIKKDLIKAEAVSGPLSLIILGLVFGSIVAALLPVGVGLFTVVSALGVTIWLSTQIDVTNYATNIISLIGIGVSIDYSLFLVNRFREEIGRDRDIRTATAMTTATAGRAVFFSGLTVAIGLIGLLFFKNTTLPSLGIGGTLAVSIAMLFSILTLPAVLAILGHNVNKGKVPYAFTMDNDEGVWKQIATTVMNNPWAVFIPIVLLLGGAGVPFLFAEFSLSSIESLPPEDEARNGIEITDDVWPEDSQNSIFVALDFDGTNATEEFILTAMYDLISDIRQLDNVKGITGIGQPDASMSVEDVHAFWQTPEEYLPIESQYARAALAENFLAGDFTFILVTINGTDTSVESRELTVEVRELSGQMMESLGVGDEKSEGVGGFPAYNQDSLDAITENLASALLFIFGATTILIYIQVKSVLIPFKAIAMNVLSISASFGMLVFVFQWGFGQELLNFTPQAIDAGNPVIIFCIVFGLSMDYEVLMLSRIHEEWERTGDNTLAVANGLQKTGKLITGAAAIMVVVFSAFGLSSVVVLKQIGFGLALAIFIDATFVRALVVPSAMRLMGKWNWWSPKFLGGSSIPESASQEE